ncbi:hypothetical protein O6H91_06G107500 [Diphasiastrum complanatum]|uniref:Uncharacterized protein n=1 Tax=Diphasiastrum complanatum TaxID=34168 RepID=A0ACC2DHX6_DIPCM|nr:hypothetical protein O6H91_06G107500 [Diphasiastrum complanatum]
MHYASQKGGLLYLLSSSATHPVIAAWNKGNWNQEYDLSMPNARWNMLPQAKGGLYPPTPRGMPRRRKTWTSKHRIEKPHGKNVPCAPRNTTSFIMRSSKMGITAPLMSPATPLLQTPMVSPVSWPQESLGDGQAKNDFKVDAYGSMKGCIRLRDMAESDDCTELISGTSQNGESDGEHHLKKPASSLQQLEERLDHGLQRFELLYNLRAPDRVLSTRMEDQETHIAYLEEENLLLQQRLLQTQQELEKLRRRLSPPALSDFCCDESIGDGSCAS